MGKLVAEGAWSYLTHYLAPVRVADKERRRAIAVWLLVVLAVLAWVGVIGATLVLTEFFGIGHV